MLRTIWVIIVSIVLSIAANYLIDTYITSIYEVKVAIIIALNCLIQFPRLYKTLKMYNEN